MNDLYMLELEASRSVSVSSIMTALLSAIASLLFLRGCYDNLPGAYPAAYILVDGTRFHPPASIYFFIPQTNSNF